MTNDQQNKYDTTVKQIILAQIELALINEELYPNAIKIIDKKGNLCCKRWVFMDFLRKAINEDENF